MASSLPVLLLVVCSLGVAQALVLRVYNLRATGLYGDETSGTDGYVKVFCGSTNIGTTSVKSDCNNPSWDDEFAYLKAKVGSKLRLQTFDQDPVYDDLLGTCWIFVEEGTWSYTCDVGECGTLYFYCSLT